MTFARFSRPLVMATLTLLASACATAPVAYDYTALRQSKPRTLLVLPPVNHSPDVNASASLLAQTSYPLAESGYYVLPVALVNETFRHNGLEIPEAIHALAPAKLHDIFGADAAVYIDIQSYGSSYKIVASDAVVTASAKLVDLRSGALLWEGSATASSAETRGSNQAGLLGLLVQAVIEQIANSVSNKSHVVAGITSQRLLTAHRPNGLLYGPRSPLYGSD